MRGRWPFQTPNFKTRNAKGEKLCLKPGDTKRALGGAGGTATTKRGVKGPSNEGPVQECQLTTDN